MNSKRGGLILCIAIAVALAAPVRAEVRLIDDAASSRLVVDVTTTPRGPWTPTGGVTARVLNPSGDLFGDSMPGWDTRITSVQAAWIRPGSGAVSRALGFAPGWISIEPIPSPGAVGAPLVDVLTGGWTVTWQASAVNTGSRVLVTGSLPDGHAVDPLVVQALVQ